MTKKSDMYENLTLCKNGKINYFKNRSLKNHKEMLGWDRESVSNIWTSKLICD